MSPGCHGSAGPARRCSAWKARRNETGTRGSDAFWCPEGASVEEPVSELTDPSLASCLFYLVMGQVMVCYVVGTGDLEAPNREAFVDEVLLSPAVPCRRWPTAPV